MSEHADVGGADSARRPQPAEEKRVWDAQVAEDAMMAERGWIGGVGVPMLKDNWEVNEETDETEWVPFMLASPPMPGYPGPDRYAEFPGDADED